MLAQKVVGILFSPISIIYSSIVSIRNKFFDWGIYKQTSIDVPVISVGNLTVGGTGKTPHVEYLIKLLKDKYKIATLSRGYGRKSKGHYEAQNDNLTADVLGDEPLQIKTRFPEISVNVSENRVQGAYQILINNPEVQVILLDDAYQHRFIKPDLSILLVDYHRPIYKDYVMPSGRLREPKAGIKRANIVIVSKCPENISENEMAYITKKLKTSATQKVFFSTISYGKIVPVFKAMLSSDLAKNIVLVTGIANPKPLIKHLDNYNVTHLKFPDHYSFTDADIEKILKTYDDISDPDKMILTTEKDAVRLRAFKKQLAKYQDSLFYLPIEVKMVSKEKEFNELVLRSIN